MKNLATKSHLSLILCVSFFLGSLLGSFAAEARGVYLIPLKSESKIVGSYTVPISEPQLLSYSLNEIEVKFTGDQFGQVIKYDLPQTLTGIAEEIEVSSSNPQSGIYTGMNADCECIAKANEVACVLKYKNLQGNNLQANEFIESMSVDMPTKNQLKRVAQVFACDPVGVLHFRTDQIAPDPLSSLRLELVNRVLQSSSCQL